jgi:hypothetical protein
MWIVFGFCSWKKRAERKGKHAWLREEAHLQYAGKAPAVREAEQSREYDRYCIEEASA